MRKKISDHLNISLIYLAVISILRFKLDLNLIPFWIGGLLGAVILYSDYFFQVFLVQPELDVSKEAKRLYKEGKYKDMYSCVVSGIPEIKSLTFHTVLFQIIFNAFGLFVVTSTSSYLGQGLILSALLYLLTEQYRELKKNGQLGADWFSRINVKPSPQSQKYYLTVMVVLFIILTSFVLK